MTQTPEEELRRDVEQVAALKLEGAPKNLVLDTGSILTVEGSLPYKLAEKLVLLATEEKISLIVVCKDSDNLAQIATDAHPHLAPLLTLSTTFPDTLPPDETLVIISDTSIGSGLQNSWLAAESATDTDTILALFGTALVQERAGVAFRAAGEGKPMPASYPFDQGIYSGVANSFQPPPMAPAEAERITSSLPINLDDQAERHSLIQRAYAALTASLLKNGAIVAAPLGKNPGEPNYWFHWQRDSAQVAKTLFYLIRHPELHPLNQNELASTTQQYLAFSRQLSAQENLAVSRFTVEGSPILTYGNPQLDGPALTALAVMAQPNQEQAWQSAQPYLDFLASSGVGGVGFDPWEFSVGTVFNAQMLACKSLRLGQQLAMQQGDSQTASRYAEVQEKLEEQLLNFSHPEHGYLVSVKKPAIAWMGAISNLDIGVIGSILAAYDVTDGFLNVEDERVTATMLHLEQIFAYQYPINRHWQSLGREGMGLGRFPEDANDGLTSQGGNPWSFATLWGAQYYYRLVQRNRYLERNLAQEKELIRKGDGFVQFLLAHLPADALTEQIDKTTGQPRGAHKLAWALAELIHTLAVRQELTAAHSPE